jgi:hypothetical protein
MIKIIGALVVLVVAPSTDLWRTYSRGQCVDKDWVCPTVLVDCQESSSARNIRFKARVDQGVPATNINYKWRVSGGKITSGQGTEEITVKSKRRKGQRVTATLEILGIPKSCSNKASCWTAITSP